MFITSNMGERNINRVKEWNRVEREYMYAQHLATHYHNNNKMVVTQTYTYLILESCEELIAYINTKTGYFCDMSYFTGLPSLKNWLHVKRFKAIYKDIIKEIDCYEVED